ncbi:hypothetical protein AB0B41_42705, partial [Pseudonocardia sp. NPDC049154]
LLPDAPVVVAGATVGGRARALARDGFLLLTGARVDHAAATRAAAAAPGPVRVLALPEIDPGGTFTATLAARPDEVWVVRPDAHVAAVLAGPTTEEITAALHRAAAHPVTREESHDGVLQASR